MNIETGEKLPCIFVYMFYCCTISGLIQYFGFLSDLIMCRIHPQRSFLIEFASFIIYLIFIIHLSVSWLARLYYTFYGSCYAKSARFYFVTCIAFIIILLSSVCGLIVRYFISFLIGSILIAISGLGYVLISSWLLFVFSRHLLDLATLKIVSLEARTTHSLKQQIDAIDNLPFHDEKYLKLISKYFVLGLLSFLPTLLVLIATMIQTHLYLFLSVVRLLAMIDVVINVLCIYLQYKFANDMYYKLCGCLDKCVHLRIHNKAVHRIRKDTFSYYHEKFKPSVDPYHTDSPHATRIVTFPPKSTQLRTIPSGISDDGDIKEKKKEIKVELEQVQEGQESSIDLDKLMNYKAVDTENNEDLDGTERKIDKALSIEMTKMGMTTGNNLALHLNLSKGSSKEDEMLMMSGDETDNEVP